MLMLYDDRDLIEEVLEMSTVYHEIFVKKLLQYDLTFFCLCDDIAYKTGTVISPRVLRKMWLPRMNRLMSPIVNKGIPILYHSDGNIWEMIPDLLDMGVNAINPIEPYGMDIIDVKRRSGKTLL